VVHTAAGDARALAESFEQAQGREGKEGEKKPSLSHLPAHSSGADFYKALNSDRSK